MIVLVECHSGEKTSPSRTDQKLPRGKHKPTEEVGDETPSEAI